MKSSCACLLVGAALAFIPALAAVRVPVTRVGAVNWDCSVPSSTFFGKASTRALGPAKYRERTPYYAEVTGLDSIDYRERTLEEYEQEMRYAIEAGIDYCAYCWYDRTPPPGSIDGMSETCKAADGHLQELTRARQLHARSALRDRLGFCAILVVVHPYSDAELEALAEAMQDPAYEKIEGRPLVYAYVGPWQEPIGRLRSICRRKGVADPYVALMQGGKAKAEEGVEALTAYACAAKAETFADLVARSVERNDKRANTGLAVIPHLSVGWDPSPRIENPVPWATYPAGRYSVARTNADFAYAASKLKTWIDENPESTPTGHVLAFAWNEFEEGGWICPTIGADGKPDVRRVRAFRAAVNELKGVVWPTDGDGVSVGWMEQPHDLADIRVENGVLKWRVTGIDPFFRRKLAQPFEGMSGQCIRLKVRASHPGTWDFFWRSAGNGRFGGPDVVHFRVEGTNVWNTLELRLHWSGEGEILEMRIDPVGIAGGTVELAEFAVVERPLRFKPVSAEEATGVMFEAVSDEIAYGMVTWHATGARGLMRMPFTTAADGATHTYWFNLAKEGKTYKTAAQNCWKGMIDYLSLERMPDGAIFPGRRLRTVSGTPDLPPDIGISSVMPAEAIPRAGRPFTLEIVLRNYGTSPAKNLRFSFPGLPSALTVADTRELSPTGEVAAAMGRDSVGIGHDYAKWRLPNERVFHVTFKAPQSGKYSFDFKVSASGCEPRRKRVDVEILPSLHLERTDYVPEPKPVKTGIYRVGATSFPGWTLHDWHAIRSRAPERKPVLGWYDESKVETVDWQIKQLVENGISWLLVCWYWDWRTKTPGRGTSVWPETFQQTRYRRYLKWCLQWGIYSSWDHAFTEDDMREAATHWCGHYFNTDEYLKIDGFPVVCIYTGYELKAKFGEKAARGFLEVARECARRAGFPGIHFVAQRGSSDPALAAELASLGFDRMSIYKYLADDASCGRWDAPRDFGSVVETSLAHWRHVRGTSPIKFFPSLSTGYDPRPWIGAVNNGIVTNVTASGFRRICEDAKRFSDESGERYLLMGPLDEWGEGSIGYPNRALGFGMLEAVRDTFGEKPAEGWSVNCTPEDVGLKCPQIAPCQ